MRYAKFSDVHANPTALENVVEDARRCGIAEFVCLGDTVGYGPLPSETVSSVRSIAHIVLAGNHDAATRISEFAPEMLRYRQPGFWGFTNKCA